MYVFTNEIGTQFYVYKYTVFPVRCIMSSLFFLICLWMWKFIENTFRAEHQRWSTQLEGKKGEKKLEAVKEKISFLYLMEQSSSTN